MTVEELREEISSEYGDAAIFGGETEAEIKEIAELLSATFGVSIGDYLKEEYTAYPYLFLDKHDNGTATVEGYVGKQDKTIQREDALTILYTMSDTSINAMDVL